MSDERGKRVTVIGDNPIRSEKDDALGRAPLARSFARQVLALDSSEGVVVGVLGAWGSGKTSFVNLARHDFESASIPILDFNPWMFSGADQLVESFFVELATQLKIRPGLADVGKHLEDYGETFSGMAWLPLVGPWLERSREATKILGKILQRRKEGVGGRRAKLQNALKKLERPIVVVLDDIDRLSTSEIRDVFKLVRLTASFPRIVYILAFDRVRIEEALAEQGIPGRDYLEKILQVAVDLPVIPGQVLGEQILTALDRALGDIKNPGRFDEQVWPDIFMEIIRPLIRNMRDVRRYAAAIHGTVETLNGQIALPDVLALEAIRIFLPDVFQHLRNAVEGLTTTSDMFQRSRGSDTAHLKAPIDALIRIAGAQAEIVRAAIERLFPAGKCHVGGSHYGADFKGRWLRERRVAHEDILRLYLERVAGEKLRAFTEAEQAWACMADRDALDGYLRSLDPGRLEDVIGSLETYEDQFSVEHVVPAISVLLNLLADLPERKRGMFGFDTRTVVARVTYRLLRSLGDPAVVEASVRQILPRLKSLSSKLELISQVGYREDVGHRLVSSTAASEFEKAWRDEVRGASVYTLPTENHPFTLLSVAKRQADPSEPALVIDTSPQLTLALLRDARTEALSQSSGSRAIRRFPRLAWDALVELYGDEPTLRRRIENVKEIQPSHAEDLLQLADKYLSGWRPKDFGDE